MTYLLKAKGMKNVDLTSKGYRGNCRNLILLLLHFIVVCPSYTQINLVPNPGFDVLKFCPDNAGQLSAAPPWETTRGTPDIFHACALTAAYRTPFPYICTYLPPHNGGGYAGITVYGTREYLETALIKPLRAGKPYYIRFFVAADENCQLNQPPGFSDAVSLMLRRTGPTENFEIIVENSGEVINDTSNWTKISGCYYAKGMENEVRIGNPKSDAQSIYETTTPNYPYPENYLFVDDVFIGTFDPFPDTVLLCEGTPLLLDASFLDAGYRWDTGETTAVKTTNDPGRFAVEATIGGCVFRDTVTAINPPPDNFSMGDSLLCGEQTIVLTAPIAGTYLWSDNSTDRQKSVNAPGLYSVTIASTCGEFVFSQAVQTEPCRCRVYVPNIFSPNNDNRNDLLDISIGCAYEYTLDVFEIYDRWGNRIFVSKDLGRLDWDGNIREKKAPPGVYLWRLTYTLRRNGNQLEITEKGDVTLVR